MLYYIYVYYLQPPGPSAYEQTWAARMKTTILTFSRIGRIHNVNNSHYQTLFLLLFSHLRTSSRGKYPLISKNHEESILYFSGLREESYVTKLPIKHKRAKGMGRVMAQVAPKDILAAVKTALDKCDPRMVKLWADWREPAMPSEPVPIILQLKRRRLELDEQADAALELERTLPVHERMIRYADPSTGKRLEGERDDVGRTVTSIWSRRGFHTIAARRHSRVLGWRQIQMLLNTGSLTIEPGCRALLQELRDAVYHEDGPEEDIDESCEDHLLDALRYAVGSIALLRPPADQSTAWQPGPPTTASSEGLIGGRSVYSQ